MSHASTDSLGSTAPVATRRGTISDAAGRVWPFALALLLAWLMTAFVHGSLPGLVRDAPSQFIAEGQALCLSEQGLFSILTPCQSMGLELGAPILFGLPPLALSMLTEVLLGASPRSSLLAASLILDLTALLAGWVLLRRVGTQSWVALLGALAYQCSIGVVGLASFGGTFWGFVLLPLYVLMYLVGADMVSTRRPRSILAGGTLLLLSALLAIFTDGYSFIVSALMALVLVATSFSTLRAADRLAAVASLLASQALAILVYKAYVPGGANFPEPPESFFRAMGADLATIFRPGETVWLADMLRISAEFKGLWGDGTNANFNYLGLVTIILAVLSLASRKTRMKAAGLGIFAVVSLFLAIGPSVKVGQDRPPLTPPITYKDYLMPDGVAALDLPWGPLMAKTPGLSDMRATYRWLLGTRFALIAMAGLGATVMLSSERRAVRLAGTGLMVVAFIEVLPNVPETHTAQERKYQTVVDVETLVVDPLDELLHPSERILMVPSGNDYLATFIAPYSDVRSYNVGGDKNNGLSRATWPAEVTLAASEPGSESFEAALSQSVDAVVVVYFDLRWNAYSFPPSEEQQAAGRQLVESVRGDPDITLTESEYFSVLRLAEVGHANHE